MEIEIASPNEKEKMMMRQFQAQQAPLAQQQPGMGQQMMDMAKQRAMSGVLDAGQAGLTSGIKSALAPTVASGVEGGAMLGPMAGSGAMAGMATAVPYVGAGLLAGKALGLFNEGGMVGPLSTQYHAGGSNPDTLKSYIGRNPESIDALKTEYDARNKANMDYLVRKRAEQMAQKPTSMPVVNDIVNQFTNPYPSEYERQQAFNRRFVSDYGDLLNQYKAAKGYEQGGQVGMTRQQAMALMNNQPDPDQLYDEIVAESMTETAQQQMPMPKMRPPLAVDPMGADTTSSPYDMLQMYNTPNT